MLQHKLELAFIFLILPHYISDECFLDVDSIQLLIHFVQCLEIRGRLYFVIETGHGQVTPMVPSSMRVAR